MAEAEAVVMAETGAGAKEAVEEARAKAVLETGPAPTAGTIALQAVTLATDAVLVWAVAVEAVVMAEIEAMPVATKEAVEEARAKAVPATGPVPTAGTIALPAVTLATVAVLLRAVVEAVAALLSSVQIAAALSVALVDSGKVIGCVAVAIITLLAAMNATAAERENPQGAEVGPPTCETAVMGVATVVGNATMIEDTAADATAVDLLQAGMVVTTGT